MSKIEKKYDALVIGGGPAGIAAAKHLGFHQRKVLIVDRRTSPMQFATTAIHNYPGISPLSSAADILRKMRKELSEFDVQSLFGNAIKVSGRFPKFEILVTTGDGTQTLIMSKTLVFATGISRKHPRVGGDWKKWLPFAAKKGVSYYCCDCDSPQTTGKDVLIVNAGTANSAIHTARCIQPYARRIRIFMTEDSYAPFTKESKIILNKSGFEWTHGLIKGVKISKPGEHQLITTADGRTIECNIFFVSWVAVPRSELAKSLDIALDDQGNIVTDHRGKTNVEGIWAAGDVRPITQSVATAVGTGVYAAIMIVNLLLEHEK